MQLCLNTSTLANPSDPALGVEAKARLAAAAGCAQIEVWNDELTVWEQSGRDLAELRTIVADAGLSVASVISLRNWQDTDGAEYQAALDDTRRRMAQAAAVGAPRIVATPTIAWEHEPYHFDLERTAERYRVLLELGREFGVVPMMEFLGFVRSVYLLEQAVAIAQLADHPDACVVLDPFHLWRGGSGLRGVGRLPAELVGICHFNDAPADDPPRCEQRDADRVYPGDGCLPLAAMLRALAANGYDGPLSLELFNPGYWALAPTENLRRGVAKTKAVLAEAGLA